MQGDTIPSPSKICTTQPTYHLFETGSRIHLGLSARLGYCRTGRGKVDLSHGQMIKPKDDLEALEIHPVVFSLSASDSH